ncbi:helix-turn-helix domain-containing protein [Halopiger xanaduensis]|uniref:Bacterio-opsin activator HTH domain protein n=1 Tax=Halopiger xanaduensis (strain DSM 18323 / JCM 14033 / SH-6) TaxID=797210 RepID=F8D9D4_HALXS|nr:helix-turn-helix domain-containing protein [Halopiger xanaduensis]AEH36875.1 Bacterio-opsin activator HTH domain protein [Halopiger xanaduensis SH-6]
MIFATLLVDYPILRGTLSHAPDAIVTWEQSDLTGDGAHRMLVWVDGDDDAIAAFDDALEADPTVAEPLRVVDFDERRLYHLELTCEGHRESVYPIVVEGGGVLQDVTATAEGWFFRVAFPSAETFGRFHEFFVERDLDVEVRQLYDVSDRAEDSNASPNTNPPSQFGLTASQRETLVAAVDAGYLDIPRACSLAELADRFDISSNAASERFRRGVRTLIENSIYPEDRSP